MAIPASNPLQPKYYQTGLFYFRNEAVNGLNFAVFPIALRSIMKPMKPVIALCLLCVTSAWAQNPPANMVMESSVPAIQVNFVGQDGGFYKFSVKNASEHGVTAFNVRLLPAENKTVAGKLECDNRCGETGELGTKSRPVIAPGGVFPLSYPVNTVTGGVMVEAVLLDDNTFQGDEHAAARLLAQKIGFQAEHDRILPVVSRIMSDSRLDDPGKIVQLRQELQWLSVDADPAAIQSFQQKFSNSADCGDTCTQLMQSTATSEKQLVLSKLEQFASEDGANGASLAKWWEETKQNVISFSCDDCAPPTPKPVTEPPVLRQPPDGNGIQRIIGGKPPAMN
jgi:hypothetical protein